MPKYACHATVATTDNTISRPTLVIEAEGPVKAMKEAERQIRAEYSEKGIPLKQVSFPLVREVFEFGRRFA